MRWVPKRCACSCRASSAEVRTERARAGAAVAQQVLRAQAQALLTALKALQVALQPHMLAQLTVRLLQV